MTKYCNEHVSECVCPRAYLVNHMRDLYQIFVHVAYRRGSVLLRKGDKIPRGSDNFGVFFPTDSALYSIAFGTHTKMAESIENRDAVRDDDSAGPNLLPCVRWGSYAQGDGAIFVVNAV